MGSILLILILYQYIKTRRLIAETCNRGSWWGPGESELAIDPGKVSGNYGRVSSFKIWSRKESIYDRALITRFTIGFVIMGFVYELPDFAETFLHLPQGLSNNDYTIIALPT